MAWIVSNRLRLTLRAIRALAPAAMLLMLTGCGALGPYLSNDVPLRYQREQIKRFDPYPDQDIAPPMVGVRPPDFSAPAPEGERAFWGMKRPMPW
jgi:hypothetical protein